ncbi:SDR family NAD(P)-dependent oxidoreductase [Thermobifida cellulosilytica]|uniref:2-deoxy-D-gluconate 3-dehydrogenase n=1 Tax=Thermobifida cellulosilytica TB100 TaxID=665004 RepID=A0A147KKI1_THECS|nr:glucose 1-dehydrogenase [Thermobifida cellulosilytica]KUP97835.1 2-deoxy-D-gluconate 3-dehydrogenase [Thermobifida cellulosilytica TB100]
MAGELEGKVALVTGASRGIGAAIARGYAERGALVVGAARSADQLRALAATDPEHISTATVDLRDEESLSGLVDLVVERHGRIDVLVNNAGVAPAADFATEPVAQWRNTLEVNVIAPMTLAQAAGRHFIAQGGGKIINIASTTGVRGKPGLVGYSASKGAMVRFTESLAAEWARHNIQVNCIAPGAFATDAQSAVLESPDLLHRRVRRIPAKRMGDVSELVPLACLLAAPGSDFITGSVFVVDGGESGKL